MGLESIKKNPNELAFVISLFSSLIYFMKCIISSILFFSFSKISHAENGQKYGFRIVYILPNNWIRQAGINVAFAQHNGNVPRGTGLITASPPLFMQSHTAATDLL